MMKKLIYILCVAVVVMSVSSCRDDGDFTESIFDTTIPAVDPNSATAPFDQWLYPALSLLVYTHQSTKVL